MGKPGKHGSASCPEDGTGDEFSKNENNESRNGNFYNYMHKPRTYFKIIPDRLKNGTDLQTEENKKNIESY